MTPVALIVNWNAGTHLLDCVRSLQAEGVTDIVVADNGSTDGSLRDLAAAEPSVVAFETGANLGFGGGVNRAAARSADLGEGCDLLVLNPDVVMGPGSVKAMMAAAESTARVGVVGPRIDTPDGMLYPSARTFPSLRDSIGHAFLGMVWPTNPFTRRYRMLDWDHGQRGDVDWVSGSCFLIRAAAWRDVEGFDEAYFMYAEDVDLCWRVRRAGWDVVYEPEAVVVHVQGLSTSRRPYRMIAAHHRSLLRFAIKTTTGVERLLLPLMAVGLGARTVLAWVHHRFSRG
ncbi:MAG: glycosyltransferase family 2 protein [Acidimicrobiales bacterium]